MKAAVSLPLSGMDALADSLFRMLDDSTLDLVLQGVGDGDALCAALACTPFRDALVAQRRHAVNPPGEPRPGMRMVTSVAGVAASAARLAWARDLGAAGPAWVRSWNKSTCTKLIAVGALPALRWAREEAVPRCPWVAYRVCKDAAAGGHLELLRWALTVGRLWGETTCENAARGGHLHVLEWLRAQDPPCPWNRRTCSEAAKGGHLHVLKWARVQAPPWRWDEDDISQAALYGHLQCLQFMHEQHCPWDAYTCSDAAQGGHLECLQYARKEGCEWNEQTLREALDGLHCALARWARASGCPVPDPEEYDEHDYWRA
jgi:hypothetical protein